MVPIAPLHLDASDARRRRGTYSYSRPSFPERRLFGIGAPLLVNGRDLGLPHGSTGLTAGILGGLAARCPPVGVWIVLPLAIEVFLERGAGRLRPWRPMWRPAVGWHSPAVLAGLM